MPHEQPLVTTLRGRGSFSRVISSGTQIEKKPIKAFIKIGLDKETSICVGYAVTRGTKKAVHRNRLKRLLREAIKVEKEKFSKWTMPGTKIEVVFMYYGNIDPNIVHFSSVKNSVSEIFATIKLFTQPENK